MLKNCSIRDSEAARVSTAKRLLRLKRLTKFPVGFHTNQSPSLSIDIWDNSNER